ncbi:MAG: histone deacetylase [Acidobacteriota bacterium]
MTVRGYYCDHFVLPLPDGHRFPMDKYRLLRERITHELPQVQLSVPQAAEDHDILRVHTPDYLEKIVTGTLSKAEIRRIGFPWSPQLIERSRRSVGGTIAAAEAALQDGVGINLAGGTHHAFPDRGEGFCVLNDVAIAARRLQANGHIKKALIIDLDVHQGNGTAAIFRDDPSVYTLSVHGRRNYPFHKEESDLDVALEDGADDHAYLHALETALDQAFHQSQPDAVFFIAGADPYTGDKLGRLALTKKGLATRDLSVLEICRRFDLPIALSMAGGYATQIDDIVDIHFQTVQTATTQRKTPTKL